MYENLSFSDLLERVKAAENRELTEAEELELFTCYVQELPIPLACSCLVSLK